MNQKSEQSLQKLMREGWDSRISSDYLSWMNDRVNSDAELWSTGDRDLQQLLQELEISELNQLTALELGCGVGRLLKGANKFFQKLTGVDVSKEAISKASKLLEKDINIELRLSDGTSLDFIADDSIDFVYSFGVLSNMPVYACAKNLLEIARILKCGGRARLQVFLGLCQPTIAEDTIAYRSFDRDAFCKVAEGIGFSVEWIKPLQLDIEVPDDGWLRPEICSLIKVSSTQLTATEIEEILVPGGEQRADSEWPGSYVEYQLSLLRAEELAKAGHPDKALAAVKFAVQRYRNADTKLIEIAKSF